jgi:hypothetical protein
LPEARVGATHRSFRVAEANPLLCLEARSAGVLVLADRERGNDAVLHEGFDVLGRADEAVDVAGFEVLGLIAEHLVVAARSLERETRGFHGGRHAHAGSYSGPAIRCDDPTVCAHAREVRAHRLGRRDDLLLRRRLGRLRSVLAG